MKELKDLLENLESYADNINDTLKYIREVIGENQETVLFTAAPHEISDSWDEIIKSTKDGTYLDKYRVGDWKPLDLGSEGIVNMQLVGKDADTSIDGKIVPTTWIAKELLKSPHRMNRQLEQDENYYVEDYVVGTGAVEGWRNSEMRCYLEDEIYPLIPENVRKGIERVRKWQNSVNEKGKFEQQKTVDKLWIPSFDEIGENGYELFQDKENLAKGYVNFASASGWWLRSANGANYFRYVHSSGGDYYGNANYSRGVALGFSI